MKNWKITKFTECVDIACSALKSTDLDVYKELSALKEKSHTKNNHALNG